MTKAYHGKNSFYSILPQQQQEILIRIKSQPKDMNFIIKIVETYSHVALAVQIDPQNGILGFHTTKDQEDKLRAILNSIPRTLRILGCNE